MRGRLRVGRPACGHAAQPGGQLREWICGEYLDAPPGRWLAWHGHGPFGRNRYACADLTAAILETYGTLGPQPWKRPPYATSRRTEYTERAIRAARGQSSFGRS